MEWDGPEGPFQPNPNPCQRLTDDGEEFIPREWGLELGYIQPLVSNSLQWRWRQELPGRGSAVGLDEETSLHPFQSDLSGMPPARRANLLECLDNSTIPRLGSRSRPKHRQLDPISPGWEEESEVGRWMDVKVGMK